MEERQQFCELLQGHPQRSSLKALKKVHLATGTRRSASLPPVRRVRKEEKMKRKEENKRKQKQKKKKERKKRKEETNLEYVDHHVTVANVRVQAAIPIVDVVVVVPEDSIVSVSFSFVFFYLLLFCLLLSSLLHTSWL